MKEINSYSSPFNFGHKALENLFDGEVVIQEKIDGSQISFMLDESGELFIRSRKSMVNQLEPDMFSKAVTTIKGLALRPGYKYRGEFLQKPKHNTICYDRVPEGNIILFDVDMGDQDYMHIDDLKLEADRLSLECVRSFNVVQGKPTVEYLEGLLKKESVLGGAKIEGIVLKNYSQYDRGKKVLMAKYVSPEFKEKHSNDWKKRNPSKKDVTDILIDTYHTEARWDKAIQHLKEEGKIEGVVQDIPVLLKEISQDIKAECEEEIKEKLFKHFWKAISRGVTRGLPEYYKKCLLDEALQPVKERTV